MGRLALGVALGAVSAFVALACTSTSSTPNTGMEPVSDAASPVKDSGAALEDAGAVVDSASPPVDSGDSGAASDAAASYDVASVCVGCASRLSVNGPLAPTCTNDGPPSSHQLLDDWGDCLCVTSTCAATCAVCSNGQAAVTQACINCGQQACPSQYAACAADTEGFTGDAGD